MDYKKLNCFIALFEEESFSKAADRLYMAQSSFSTQIKGIEEELGVILVNRSNKRDVSFTKEAKLFYDYCKSALSDYNALKKKISISSNKSIRNIGLFYSSRLDNWARKISLHNEDNQNVKYNIVFSYGKEKYEQFMNDEVFISLFLRRQDFDKQGIPFVHKYYDYNCIGVPYSHELAKKDSITPDDLKDKVIFITNPAKTYANQKPVSTLINKYGLKQSNFECKNRIGDLHYSMKTENAIILMPSDLMPESCKIFPLDFDEDFKLEYGFYYKKLDDDVQWVLDNL